MNIEPNEQYKGKIINKYLDKENKIYVLPKKKDIRLIVYSYLAEKFEMGREYKEKEVNSIISNNHSFNDTCLVRREMIEYGLLSRNDNGTSYKKSMI